MTTKEEVQEVMNQKLEVENISQARVTLHSNNPESPLIHLNPGKKVVLSRMEFDTIYGKSISIFQGSRHLNVEVYGHDNVEPKPPQDEDLLDDEIQSQSDEDDAGGEQEESDVKVDVKALKKQIEELQAEYKSKESSLDRKQEIKEELHGLKKQLKKAQKAS